MGLGGGLSQDASSKVTFVLCMEECNVRWYVSSLMYRQGFVKSGNEVVVMALEDGHMTSNDSFEANWIASITITIGSGCSLS